MKLFTKEFQCPWIMFSQQTKEGKICYQKHKILAEFEIMNFPHTHLQNFNLAQSQNTYFTLFE